LTAYGGVPALGGPACGGGLSGEPLADHGFSARGQLGD
jgi:hypothetical protein